MQDLGSSSGQGPTESGVVAGLEATLLMVTQLINFLAA